jgi:NAD(P)-dependent dehydrogenase (short-subunit alcohol dehydrogenase family)
VSDTDPGRAARTLVVTGGGRGIGRATCLAAARDGWAVCVDYARDADSAEAVAAEIRAAGGQALAVQADVSVEADVVRLFETVDRELPALGGLVNNAGVVDRAARVEAIDRARLERIFATNVYSVFACTREALRRMKGRGGAIVNVSSVAARLGAPGQYVDYAATKGAIDTFTTGLALEVAGEGIRVNAVRPGIIATDIHASGGQPDRAQRLAHLIPMARPGTADEVAEAIVWLLSDRAAYTTGTVIDVAGGR